MSKQIEIEADSLHEARKQVQSQLGDGNTVLHEDIVADGKPQTVEAVADTAADAYTKAEAQMPSGARAEKREVRTEPKRSLQELQGEDEQGARRLVSLGHAQRLDAFTLKTPGKKGFWGSAKSPPSLKPQFSSKRWSR